MRTIKFLLSCLAILAFSLHLSAQTTATPAAPPPPNYYLVDYMKATPGHQADYERLERGVWKDIHKARIKKGRITAWWFLEVRMPGGADREYDYVTVTTVSGWNNIDSLYNSWGEVFASLTKEQAKHVDSTEMFRTLVRTEIYTDVDAVFKNPPGTGTPPKYWFVNHMDVPEGKWDAYVKLEKELVKPVHQEQVKNGHRDGWGAYSLVFPWGAQEKYDAVTIDFYQKWSDVTADDVWAMWQKVHPGKKAEDIDKAINESRTLVKGELRVLLDYAQ